MWRFLLHVNQKYGLQLNGYPDLYKWSVDNAALFWGEVWHFVGIKASKGYDKVRLTMRLCMVSVLLEKKCFYCKIRSSKSCSSEMMSF